MSDKQDEMIKESIAKLLKSIPENTVSIAVALVTSDDKTMYNFYAPWKVSTLVGELECAKNAVIEYDKNCRKFSSNNPKEENK